MEWIKDGFCDDMNNNEACNYDGGDCCGILANIQFCLKCQCISKSIKQKVILQLIINTSIFWILDFTCSTDSDCHHGYCENQKCICLHGHAVKEDCSFSGSEFDNTLVFVLQEHTRKQKKMIILKHSSSWDNIIPSTWNGWKKSVSHVNKVLFFAL